MIRVMLSPTSIAGFSAGAMQPGFGQANPVHRVRAVGAQPPQPAAPAPVALPGRDSEATPGRLLPRGSLLDLSV